MVLVIVCSELLQSLEFEALNRLDENLHLAYKFSHVQQLFLNRFDVYKILLGLFV